MNRLWTDERGETLSAGWDFQPDSTRVFVAAPVTMLHMNKTFAILPERMDSKETSNYNKRSLNCNSSLLVKTL